MKVHESTRIENEDITAVKFDKNPTYHGLEESMVVSLAKPLLS